jgi:hypothetical protein
MTAKRIMRALAAFASDSIIDFVQVTKHGSSLASFLSQNPDFAAKIRIGIVQCIDSDSGEPWERFLDDKKSAYSGASTPIYIDGHRQAAKGYFLPSRIEIPNASRLVMVEHDPAWSCDLRSIDGVCSSKSDLWMFPDLDALALATEPSLVGEISLAALQKNLAHSQVRIGEGRGVDYYQIRAWDGRVFVMNDGGSHHLAGAHYIAKRLSAEVILTDRCIRYRLVQSEIEILVHKYAILLVNLFADNDGRFHDAMEAMKASYYHCRMPLHFGEVHAVFLPTAEAGSRRAADMLRRAGCADVGSHLLALCKDQERHLTELQGEAV